MGSCEGTSGSEGGNPSWNGRKICKSHKRNNRKDYEHSAIVHKLRNDPDQKEGRVHNSRKIIGRIAQKGGLAFLFVSIGAQPDSSRTNRRMELDWS